jgi:2-methylcitrate dehydratase PrpD
LSSWLAATQLPDIPDRVRSRATHLLLDGVGCALVGAQLSWSRIAVEAVTALDPGPSPLIGWGGRGASTSSAAMLNSSFVQGFELDDFHPTAPLHSAALVLPALIATARPDTSGAVALLGAVRAFETGPRIGAALNGGEMLIRGWHSGAVFGPLPAAVAAGTVLSLDAAGLEDALGMAATQAGGLMSAQFESMVKRMQHGFAARNGVLGAALAAAGYVGIKAVLERPYGGYLPVFGEGHDPDPSRVTEGLGELWESERIAIKPYAAMGALHAAIDGALQLRPELMGDDGTLDDVEVSSIDIAMGGGAYEHGGWPARRPLTPIGAQMNVAYTTALALLDGSVLAAQFSTARIDADDVWSLIDRTRVRHEPAIDRLPPDLRLTTIVGITRSDGTRREVTVSHPKGVGPRALSEAEVVDKFRCLTAGLLEPGRQSAIEAAVLGLEELPHFQRLIDLLTPSVARAID